MADQNDISQFIPEVGPESGTGQISQLRSEVGADASSAQISQLPVEIGADASTAQISQLPIEVGADSADVIISQLTIELGRGPEVIPPDDTPVDTFTFDEGLGNEWFIALQLSDSGDELRDKVVKSVRVTGKTTRALIKVYGYGPVEDIDVSNIEDGIGQRVTQMMTDTTQVQQSKRFPVNIPRSMNHTVRVEGIDDGSGIRDRIDEIVYEVSRQGARR